MNAFHGIEELGIAKWPRVTLPASAEDAREVKRDRGAGGEPPAPGAPLRAAQRDERRVPSTRA